MTIGYGRNIQDNGISQDEAEYMFDNDLEQCQKDLSSYTWYLNQPKNVQYALMNMCFNVGIHRLMEFRKMIRALIVKDYTTAAMEALNSKWAEEVGDRANQVAVMMREGF